LARRERSRQHAASAEAAAGACLASPTGRESGRAVRCWEVVARPLAREPYVPTVQRRSTLSDVRCLPARGKRRGAAGDCVGPDALAVTRDRGCALLERSHGRL